MYPTFGRVQVPHFRHKGKPCNPSNHLHTEGKYTFYEEFKYCQNNSIPFNLDISLVRPCNEACILKQDFNCKERVTLCRVDLATVFKNIELEKNIEVEDQIRRPDILLTAEDGTRLWVEIWVTHTDDTKKNIDNILEIKIDGEDDLMPFKEHRLDCFSGKVTCYLKGSELLHKFLNKSPESNILFPCEKYYYWEVYQTPTKKILFREFSDEYPERRPGTLYILVLRLNRNEKHDIYYDFDYTSERFDVGRVDWYCKKKLLSALPGARPFIDNKLEYLRKIEYACDGFSLNEEELNDMIGDL